MILGAPGLVVAFVVPFVVVADLIIKDCGDSQHDVENGIIRLPDFSGATVRNLNCSWSYTAAAGRKLLINVDSVDLPPHEFGIYQLQLSVDDNFYDLPRNCVNCLKEVVDGKVLNVVFSSYLIPLSDAFLENLNDTSKAEEVGSFQIRFKAFDPHRCGKPQQIENGFLISKGRKVGQSLFYRCNPPYDLIGDSELECQVTDETPVPTWSSQAPKCVIPDCTDEPILKTGSQGAIASPGYPDYIYPFTTPCIWKIVAQPNQQIRVSVTYLKLPKRIDNSFSENISRLSIQDGDSNILNLTESILKSPVNFTTLSNSLTVQFAVEMDPKIKEEIGFYLEYSWMASSCPKPKTPENGQVIAHSSGSTITYMCRKGFVLIGELTAECLMNSRWSHPTPSCEQTPPFFKASNNSMKLPGKLDKPSNKIPKHGRKKAMESNSTAKENVVNRHPTPNSFNTSQVTETGPKSEPHLHPVIVPQEEEEDRVVSPFAPDRIDVAALVYIILGTAVPLVILIILLIVILIYRKKYPVRMRFGRKFSTFENPVYVTKDAQHPKELKKLEI